MAYKEQTNLPKNGIIMECEIYEAITASAYNCDGCAFAEGKIYDLCKYGQMPCKAFQMNVIFKEWNGKP